MGPERYTYDFFLRLVYKPGLETEERVRVVRVHGSHISSLMDIYSLELRSMLVHLNVEMKLTVGNSS